MAVPGCLLIDGRHMRAALEGGGDPRFLHVVRALEEAFGCGFIRKEWHEGTQDGRPTPFHLELSAPEAGHVTPRIRQMQLQAGLAVTPDGQTTPHRVAVRVEKGVDVALALAMTQPRPPATAPHHLLGGDYELVVVVTEDGDLEAAFKASAAMRRTFVCGLRDGIAPALRRWVRSEGDRGLYLEDIIARAASLSAGPKPQHPIPTTNHHAHLLVGPASLALAALASMAAPTGSPAPTAGHAATGSPCEAAAHHHHHHRISPPPPGLDHDHPQPTASRSWLAAVLEAPGQEPSPFSPSQHSAAEAAAAAEAEAEEQLVTSGSSSRGGSSLASSLSSTGQAAARAGSPEVGPIAATLLRKGDSAPGGSYASRLLLGTSAGSSSGSKGAGGGLSSADSSPALTATTPGSVGRSPEHRPRSDDEGAAGGAGGRAGETGRRRRKAAKLRLKCFAGPLCTKLKDEEHLRRTTHPCHAGGRCPILLGPDSADKALHMERFLHPCYRGAACEIDTHEHNAFFEHPGRGLLPLCTKKGCRGGDKADHVTPHRHLCPHGRNCSFLSHSVADKRVIRHTASFLHPCPWGARCVAARAPQWNWEHMQRFTHAELPPLKAGCGGPGAEEGALAMGAEEVMQHLLLLQQQQQQQQQYQQQQQQQAPAPVAGGGYGAGGSSSGNSGGSGSHGLFPVLGSGGSSNASASTAEIMAGVLGLRLGMEAGGGGGGGSGGLIAEEGTAAHDEERYTEDSDDGHRHLHPNHYTTTPSPPPPPGLLPHPSGSGGHHHHGGGHTEHKGPGLVGGGDARDGSGGGDGGGGDGSPGGGEEGKAADMTTTTTTVAGLAAFERQFLGLFAAALPKPQAADPYHAIFAPSQQERAALPPLPMPAAPAVGATHAANAAAAAAAAVGPHGFHHHHHHHHNNHHSAYGI